MEHGFMLKEKKTCRKIDEKENPVKSCDIQIQCILK